MTPLHIARIIAIALGFNFAVFDYVKLTRQMLALEASTNGQFAWRWMLTIFAGALIGWGIVG